MARASEAFIANGWRLYCHEVFLDRYEALVAEVEKLAEENPDEFHEHRAYKFLIKVAKAVEVRIPTDPSAKEFQCATLGNHGRWRRAKQGLPDRYRLFFQYRSDAKKIIYVWLNDEHTLRKKGSRSDVYRVFLGMTNNGTIPSSFEQLLAASADLPKAVGSDDESPSR